MEILIPILILGILGLLFGIGLAIASKKLAVEVDPRLERIHGLLPGANCGACGGAGCFGFAESILSGKMNIDACRVAEEAVKEKIAHLLGQRIDKQVKKVATLHCFGGIKVKDRFVYKGIEDCAAANLVLGGQKSCVYGCLGFGDCVKACPFGAIKMSKEGLPIIDEKKCKACNKCVLICPKKLFSLVPVTHKVWVACNSHDIGKDTRAVCAVGCIACKKCEQVCPVDAIHVIDASTSLSINPEPFDSLRSLRANAEPVEAECNRRVDNLAVIDYHKCTSCGKCVEACPMKTIRKV